MPAYCSRCPLPGGWTRVSTRRFLVPGALVVAASGVLVASHLHRTVILVNRSSTVTAPLTLSLGGLTATSESLRQRQRSRACLFGWLGADGGLSVRSGDDVIAACGYEDRWGPSNDYLVQIVDNGSEYPTAHCEPLSLGVSEHVLAAIDCGLRSPNPDPEP